MREALYQDLHNVTGRSRSLRGTREHAWWRDLLAEWREMVVVPLDFDFFGDAEVDAERVIGYDENRERCYCAHRYVVTTLRSDDDEDYYIVPAYGESQTSWRLRDGRWLIYRVVMGAEDCSAQKGFYSLSEQMPR
jgi:hypothetical protein